MQHQSWYQQRYGTAVPQKSRASVEKYAALNEAKEQKKLNNKANAGLIFSEHNIAYEARGAAWLVTVGGEQLYFYPTTNKWRPKGGKVFYCSRGALDFIEKVINYQRHKD